MRQVAFLGDRASVVAELTDGTTVQALVHTRDADRLSHGAPVRVSLDPSPVLVS